MPEIFIDYTRANECEEETFGYICYQCGKCGRKFENGFMVDDGGTTPISDKGGGRMSMYLAPTIEEIDAELQALYDSIDDFTEDEEEEEQEED